MLKAMNLYGVRWLTRVCQVACRTGSGQAPKQWLISVVIPIHKKGDKRKCANCSGIFPINAPGKIYARGGQATAREIISCGPWALTEISTY